MVNSPGVCLVQVDLFDLKDSEVSQKWKVEMNATASTPYMFLLTEDWMWATPVWKEPPWFIRNITCFWLGEWDQVALHELDMTQFLSTQRPPEAPTLVGASDLLSHFIDGTEEQVDT